MFQSELTRYLPTADELPCSDDTPVDNELQELIPGLLKSILMILWITSGRLRQRLDWFCGIDMAIYYDPEQPALAEPLPWRIVPDAFISLGVERGQRYPTPAEQIKQGQIEVDRERQRSNKLAAKLRALGIDPDVD
jgi:hypothetical protein